MQFKMNTIPLEIKPAENGTCRVSDAKEAHPRMAMDTSKPARDGLCASFMLALIWSPTCKILLAQPVLKVY